MHKISLRKIISLITLYGFFSWQATSYAIEYSNTLANNHEPQLLTVNNNWFETTTISGLFLGEVIASNYNQCKGGRFDEKNNYNLFCFPRANLIVDSQVNSWSKLYFAVNFRSSCGFGGKNDEWAFTKFDKTDEAYVTLHTPTNLNYPNDTQITFGIQYMPYGNYPRHHIPASLTQLLTQTQAGGIVLTHAMQENLQISGHIFNGKSNRSTAKKINNGGIRIMYNYEFATIKLDVNIDWMYNIGGAANYVVHKGNSSNPNPLNSGYRTSVSGINFGSSLNHDLWDTSVIITTALSHFDAQDIKWLNRGAKPKAITVDGGYHFSSFKNKPSRIGASYQHSWQSYNIRGENEGRGLPKYRIQANYQIEPWINSKLGLHVILDQDYKESQGGKSRSSLTTMLSLLIRTG